MKKFLKVFYNTIFGLVILLIVMIAISFLPISGNYKLYTVQSGSMEPVIHTGSLIFSKPFDDYNKGDIVTKKGRGTDTTVTHRIIEKREENGQILFVTKGDANDSADTGGTRKDEVLGKMIVKIPLLGYLIAFARTTRGFIILVIIPAVIVIYSEMIKIKDEIKKKIDYRNRVKKRAENKKKRKDNKDDVTENNEQDDAVKN